MTYEAFMEMIEMIQARKTRVEVERMKNCEAKAYSKNRPLERAWTELDELMLDLLLKYPEFSGRRTAEMVARLGIARRPVNQ